MSCHLFRIASHTIDASHIRGFPRTTSTNQEEVLRLAVKQYTPLNHADPKAVLVTIIAAHANGFPKELYEPLWDELLKRCQDFGFGIRAIWIADVVHQGWSSVLNEDKLGNDPAWLDHSRDVLHMINVFRSQMPRPIIGVGHSMGGCQIAHLGMLHPRLFETLILIDPVIHHRHPLLDNNSLAAASAKRRDHWPSREEAEKSFRRSAFYHTWDSRVLDRWIQYGLRDTPTKLFPHARQPEVTLTTTKHQEVMTFVRPNFAEKPAENEASSAGFTVHNLAVINRRTHPDMTPLDVAQTPFYRAETGIVLRQLPFLRPSVLYLFGSRSIFTHEDLIEEKMANTGSGPGGSGGRAEGRVAQIMVQDAGHLIPMEKVAESADHTARWIGKEMVRYQDWERKTEAEWTGLQGLQRSLLTTTFLRELNAPPPPPAAKPTSKL